jgi:hypothetical protein
MEKKPENKLAGIKTILDEASLHAERFQHEYVGTEHVLLGIASLKPALLSGVGADPEAVRERTEKLIQFGPSMVRIGDRPLTPRVKRALELGYEESGEEALTPAHLLAGLLREEEGLAATVLRELGVTIQRVRETFGVFEYDPKRSEPREDVPCDHVQKFLEDLRGIYAKNRNFVTLDMPINAHCHSCSGIHKIPADLLRRPSDYGKHPNALRHIADRSRCVSDVMCPSSHYERKGDVEKKQAGLSIHRYVTGTIHVFDEEKGQPVAIRLESPVSVWTLVAEDGTGVWEETYTTKEQKDAFVRGFRAAAWMLGNPEPRINEDH